MTIARRCVVAGNASDVTQQWKLAPSVNGTALLESMDGSTSTSTGQPFCVSLYDCEPAEVVLWVVNHRTPHLSLVYIILL